MRTDNAQPLVDAARRRALDTRQRALAGLRQLDQIGGSISFAAVAQQAQVSRSWLYRQPEIRTEIEALRRDPSSSRSAPRPVAERASSQSQHQRIQALLESNRELRRANAELRAQIALLLGRARADNIVRPGPHRTLPSTPSETCPRLISAGQHPNPAGKLQITVNLLIKRIKRVGFGFRNFANYRLRLLLHGGVVWHTHATTRIRGRSPRSMA